MPPPASDDARPPVGQPSLPDAAVELLWIPLGAGQHVVRLSGRTYEALVAWLRHRPRRDLYHAALLVWHDGVRHVVEVAPLPRAAGAAGAGGSPGDGAARGVVAGGPVGLRALGRWRLFRYEVRRWPGGEIPDEAAATRRERLTSDPAVAAAVLAALPGVPTPVWGRDELRTGDMWNSNSVVSWTLCRAGVDARSIELPPGGRAPGWDAGLAVASREAVSPAAGR